MKIKTFGEMELRIAADDLAALLYRAKNSDILFAEKKAHEAKIARMRDDHVRLEAAYMRLKAEQAERSSAITTELDERLAHVREESECESGKEVIEMPSKWIRGRAQRPAPHDSQKPKAEKPKAAGKKKQADDSKKPNGKKEAK